MACLLSLHTNYCFFFTVIPDTVNIHGDPPPAEPVHEGDLLKLTCTTTGYSQPPQMKITQSNSCTNETIGTGEMYTLVTTYKVEKCQNGASYRCEAIDVGGDLDKQDITGIYNVPCK